MYRLDDIRCQRPSSGSGSAVPMIAGGVPFGVTEAGPAIAEKPGKPDSASVGTSGSGGTLVARDRQRDETIFTNVRASSPPGPAWPPGPGPPPRR